MKRQDESRNHPRVDNAVGTRAQRPRFRALRPSSDRDRLLIFPPSRELLLVWFARTTQERNHCKPLVHLYPQPLVRKTLQRYEGHRLDFSRLLHIGAGYFAGLRICTIMAVLSGLAKVSFDDFDLQWGEIAAFSVAVVTSLA